MLKFFLKLLYLIGKFRIRTKREHNYPVMWVHDDNGLRILRIKCLHLLHAYHSQQNMYFLGSMWMGFCPMLA